jgi:hypothetical protein
MVALLAQAACRTVKADESGAAVEAAVSVVAFVSNDWQAPSRTSGADKALNRWEQAESIMPQGKAPQTIWLT